MSIFEIYHNPMAPQESEALLPSPGRSPSGPDPGAGTDRDGIAIVGMSCLFPGAPNLAAYWRNILGKVDAITDPPREVWDPDLHYDPDSTDTDRVYCKRGGYLGSLVNFDPLAHGIPPVAVGGEPDQWLALQLARDALTDAGYDQLEDRLRQRTAVILGKGTYLNAGNGMAIQHGVGVTQTLELLKTLRPDLTPAELETIRRDLKRGLPPMGPETVPGLVPNVIVGRIANRLDLMGPSYTVDAACASSLIAVQMALRDLRSGECDMALVGGSQVWMPVPILSIFCQLGALSRRQQIRPFDKDADGTLLGEGIAMLVLKRLSDAERDDDRIYAVIRGVGVASDGRGLSVMAPRVEGEELALRRAYKAAGVSPRTISLIEAHGTGTPVGDLTEIQALTRVFGHRDTDHPRCALGSVKSMISHTIPAAGAAGLIKVALSLHHKILPPTLNCPEPNPKFELEKTPFYINTETRPWVHGSTEPRRAGVNAFGFGGINAHVVVEEYRPSVVSRPAGKTGAGFGATIHLTTEAPAARSTHLLPEWDTEVCVLEAESRSGLIGKIERLERYLEASAEAGPPRLVDVAYSLSREIDTSGGSDRCRLSIVAKDFADLRGKLARARERLADPSCTQIREVSGLYFSAQPLGRAGKLAFLVPGEGAQYPGMLADLCPHFPEALAQFDQVDRIYASHPRGYRTSDYLFPRPGGPPEAKAWAEERLWRMDGAMEAVLTADLALLAVLERLRIQPDALVGHSSGEYVALRAAGILDLHDEERWAWFARALEEVYDRAALEDGVPQAELVAVGAGREQVDALVREVGPGLFVAMANCPHQVVLAGERAVMARALEIARREGLITKPLEFDRPYHTPLFTSYATHLRRAIDQLPIQPAQVPLYSCTTSAPFPDDPAEVRTLMVEHWVRPVEFQRTIETLYDEGYRLFVEAGPRGNLSAFVEDSLRGRAGSFLAVPSNTQRRSGMTQLNHLVGILLAEGVALEPGYLYERRSPRLLSWDAPQVATARPAPRNRLHNAYPILRVSDEVASQILARPEQAPPGTVAPSPGPAGQRALREVSVPGGSPPTQPSPTRGEGSILPPSPLVGEGRGGGEHEPPVQCSTASPAMISAVQSFLTTMEQFLDTQERVMRDLLRVQAGTVPAGAMPPVPPAPSPNGHAHVEPAAPVTPAPEPRPVAAVPQEVTIAPAPAPAPPSRDDLRARLSARLLEIVSDRTGYPTEMLDGNLDLEADLGIDSIKRVEIFGTFRHQCDELAGMDLERLTSCRTLRQIIDLLVPAEAPPARPKSSTTGSRPDVAAFPLLGSLVSWTTGEELVTERTFDPDEDLYLRDHTLGRGVSAYDADLSALAVLPLTLSLEVLAEAAACLAPGRLVIGLSDVKAVRWITFDSGPQTLRVTARRVTGEHVVVQIHNLTEHASPSPAPVVEATVLLGDAYPPAPADALAPGPLQPSRLAPETLYTETMFHGPSWQGVEAIERTGERGTVARLRVRSSAGFFRDRPDPRFVLDPVVLDAAGQVIGFWTMEHLTRGRVIFPFHLKRLDLFGPRQPEGAAVTCTAAIALEGDHQVRSDIDVTTIDGRPWMRLERWEDKRFDLPAQFVGLLLGSNRGVSEPWPDPLASVPQSDRLACHLVPARLTADRGFWKGVWASNVCSREEREVFRSLALPDAGQIEWLAARTAAKEAVGELLGRRYGLDVRPADVEVRHDEFGRPEVDGPWSDGLPGPCAVALAQASGWAAALAVVGRDETAATDDDPRLGLALADLHARPADCSPDGFSPEEVFILGAIPSDEPDEWLLRGWCARIAASQALGTAPGELTLQAADRLSGLLTFRTDDPATELLLVGTGRRGGLILAATIAESPRAVLVAGSSELTTNHD